MFYGCSSLTDASVLTGWDVASVEEAALLVSSDMSKAAFVSLELYKHIVICLRTDNVTGIHAAGAFVFYQKNFGINNPTYKR